MTLVEVVVGIMLLATLLVLILQSYRTHTNQVRGAKERATAIRVADELLSGWMIDSAIPAVGQQAQLQIPGWWWRIVPGGPNSNSEAIGAAAVRLEIVAATGREQERLLTSVELLVSSAQGSPE